MNNRVVDYNQVKIFTTEARPARKQNEIYELILDGKIFRCERPKYLWSKFDQSLHGSIAPKEGLILFGEECSVFFAYGREWFEERLTSQYLLQYYINNPLKFIYIMSERVVKIKKILMVLAEINCHLDDHSPLVLIKQYEALLDCFANFYDVGCSVFMLYDPLVYHFKQLLVKLLDKREANAYFSYFLQAEMTKEALRLGHISEFDTESRATTYGNKKSVLFYKEPKFFYEHPSDTDVFQKIINANIDKKFKDEFFALRLLAPIAVQINEEAQYVESRMLTATFSAIMNAISSVLIGKSLIKNRGELDALTKDDVLRLLTEVAK